jgi:hypothetical protein
MEPFARTIDATKMYVVYGVLDHVDWSAELPRGDLETAVPPAQAATRSKRYQVIQTFGLNQPEWKTLGLKYGGGGEHHSPDEYAGRERRASLIVRAEIRGNRGVFGAVRRDFQIYWLKQ